MQLGYGLQIGRAFTTFDLRISERLLPGLQGQRCLIKRFDLFGSVGHRLFHPLKSGGQSGRRTLASFPGVFVPGQQVFTQAIIRV